MQISQGTRESHKDPDRGLRVQNSSNPQLSSTIPKEKGYHTRASQSTQPFLDHQARPAEIAQHLQLVETIPQEKNNPTRADQSRQSFVDHQARPAESAQELQQERDGINPEVLHMQIGQSNFKLSNLERDMDVAEKKIGNSPDDFEKLFHLCSEGNENGIEDHLATKSESLTADEYLRCVGACASLKDSSANDKGVLIRQILAHAKKGRLDESMPIRLGECWRYLDQATIIAIVHDLPPWVKKDLACHAVHPESLANLNLLGGLLADGLDPDTADYSTGREEGEVLVLRSIRWHTPRVTQLLIDYGARLPVGTVGRVIERGDMHILKLILQNYTRLLPPDELTSALYFYGLKDGVLCNQLLSAGANPNVDYKGISALHKAARDPNNETMLGLLLDHGAEIDDVDPDGCTALYLAVKARHVTNVQLLVSRGASVSKKSSIGVSSLDLAYNRCYTEMIGVLKPPKNSVPQSSSSTQHDPPYEYYGVWRPYKRFRQDTKEIIEVGPENPQYWY